ncbi:PAS domain S-box protein [Sphingomonas sp. RIT328]|uniref:PAS domain S-box protein n=1 Tax=Sphingomonas sp. RIT328 TaxID=1470591 RepID=UPI000452441F|nr:PAS domain S-box protein [Sphingomonas sp. RIT328]EZP54977.1 Signal transduction histidine kinase [Sphingomonas sp. RIT328]
MDRYLLSADRIVPVAPAPAVQAAIDAFAARLDGTDPFVVGFRDAVLPMAISDPTLPDAPIIYVNPAFERLTGYAAAEIVGRNCRMLQGPQTDADAVQRLRAALAARERVEVDLLNHRRDGSAFWNRLTVMPVFGGDGALTYFVASQADVTLERHRLIALEEDRAKLAGEVAAQGRALAERELQLQLALRAGGLGYWSFDIATQTLDVSPGCKAIFGYDADMPFDYAAFAAAVHPDDAAMVGEAIRATINDAAECALDYRIVTPAGEMRWVQTRAEITQRRDGEAAMMIGFSTDITARKFAEEHRVTLAQELTHRVKNTLATVSAVVGQSLRNATSVTEAEAAIAGRIASLGAAHDLLIRDEVEGATLREVAERALMPFMDRAHEVFTIDGPEVRLSPAVTLAVSMALHELATNAAKYGALSAAGGRVDLAWRHIDPADPHRLRLSWQESGGPPVTPPTRTGFGTRMISRVLSQHVRGQATIDYPPEGVRFIVDAVI